MTEYKSKTVVVGRPAADLYNKVTDLKGIQDAIPEQYSGSFTAQGDTAVINYGGFNIALKLIEKNPCDMVKFEDVNAPFHFVLTLHFDAAEFVNQTTLWVEFSADLNFLMKGLIGGKIQEFLDKAVDTVALGGNII